MRRALAAVLLFAALGSSVVSAQSPVWRTESMKVEVREAGDVNPRRYLLLTQELKPGEPGWTRVKLDLPSGWRGEAITLAEGKVTLVSAAHGPHELTAESKPHLDFEILDGDAKQDSVLEELWRQHAGAKP
jgi:hypothetical protein